MKPDESQKITLLNTQEEFRSVEAVVNPKQDPMKILITGSLYLNFSLIDVKLTKIEKPDQNPEELILELRAVDRTPSEKGVFNIFHYTEKIMSATVYSCVTIHFLGVKSMTVPVMIR